MATKTGLPTIRVVYATGNAGKFEEATWVFGRRENAEHTRVLTCALDPNITEIQGTMEEIARNKCEATYQALFCNLSKEDGKRQQHLVASLSGPVDYLLTEDVSLSINALCGFPGPYVKPMLEAIRPDGLWDMMSKYSDRSATATCTVSMKCMKTLTTRVFIGTISGTIVAPRGHIHHGKASWNGVFQPDGYQKTLGEMDFSEQAQFSHRKIALEKFLEFCRLQRLERKEVDTFEQNVPVYRILQQSNIDPLQADHEHDLLQEIFQLSDRGWIILDEIYATRRGSGDEVQKQKTLPKRISKLPGAVTRASLREKRRERAVLHSPWNMTGERTKRKRESDKNETKTQNISEPSGSGNSSDNFMNIELKD